jgi:hypothetical protein
MASKASSFWRCAALSLTLVVILQWILFLIVLNHRNSDVPQDLIALQPQPPKKGITPIHIQSSPQTSTRSGDHTKAAKSYKGAAVTVMLRAPKWFHRRYTVMLHNVLSNLPSDEWVVQIFANMDWLERDVLPLHPGLKRLIYNQTIHSSRIIVTPLPPELTSHKTKPKMIMKSKWLWESVVAETVLVFSGNGALCANSVEHWDSLLVDNDNDKNNSYDWIGVPWGRFGGQGGDGSTHSLRKKSAMLSILQNYPDTGDDVDSHYFVKHLLKDSETYRVAPPAVTQQFGGVVVLHTAENENENVQVLTPLVVSGTLGRLNWTDRESLLNVCPEIKGIFPSLHEPACFGAHPDPVKCRATICALRLDRIPGKSC